MLFWITVKDCIDKSENVQFCKYFLVVFSNFRAKIIAKISRKFHICVLIRNIFATRGCNMKKFLTYWMYCRLFLINSNSREASTWSAPYGWMLLLADSVSTESIKPQVIYNIVYQSVLNNRLQAASGLYISLQKIPPPLKTF